MAMRAVEPLPIEPEWTPSYLLKRGDANRDFAFLFRDGQGAPGADGTKYHAGVDWFAPGGTPVAAPVAGVVVRVDASKGSRGQVYGGVVTVQGADGVCWVMRHILPAVTVGQRVKSGQTVAHVIRWADSPASSHLHLEIWRTLAGGYRFHNMIDPRAIRWTPPGGLLEYLFEELPARSGGTGPDIVNSYNRATPARLRALARRVWGERTSVLAATDGRFYVLRWAKGTHGNGYRWANYMTAAGRTGAAKRRTAATGRMVRAYTGRARSLYPWPKGA